MRDMGARHFHRPCNALVPEVLSFHSIIAIIARSHAAPHGKPQTSSSPLGRIMAASSLAYRVYRMGRAPRRQARWRGRLILFHLRRNRRDWSPRSWPGFSDIGAFSDYLALRA